MKRARKVGRRPLLVVLFILALFFALFAPVFLLRYLSCATILLIASAYLYSRIVPSLLTVTRESVTVRGTRFEEVKLRFTVESRFPFPIAALRVAETVGSLRTERNAEHPSIPARGSVLVEISCRPQERGEFPLGPIIMSGTDPLSLFPWERELPAPGSVVVYPVVYRIELLNDRGLPAGSVKTERRIFEDLTRYRSFREYESGDDLKRVNWKASAKMGKLFTTEYDRTLYFPVRVLLNLCRDDYPQRRRDFLIERAIETAASLLVSYSQTGQAVGLTMTAEDSIVAIPERAGWPHVEELLESLARVKSAPGHADLHRLLFGRTAALPAGIRLLLVAPDLSEEQAHAAVALRKRGKSLEHVKLLSASVQEQNRELSALLRVTIVEEVGHDILRG